MTSTSLPDSLIATLPGSSYTDPGIFAQEQERIFETMWFCVARASELAKPGAFRTVDVGRESIIVTRSRDSSIRAYFNVCRHRGAKLCTEESGEVKRAFQCPYHAWTYDLNGKLVAAPNLTKMPDVGRTEYGLVSVAVREWLGYVWVCLAENPPSFEDEVIGEVVARLGDVESIERYGIEDLSLGRRIVYDVRANWKLIIENFMECYHCATIHPELTEVLPEFADGYAAQYYVGHGAEFGEEVRGFTVDGSEGLDRIPGVAEDQDRRYYAITVRPQVFVNLVPDHVIFHRMYPVAADRTIVECDWLYLPHVVDSGKDVSRSVELFDRVNRQDFDACERTQPGMSSRLYAKGGVLVPSEHHIGAFHDWVNERLGAPQGDSAQVAHPVADLLGTLDQHRGELTHPLLREPVRGPGRRDRRDDLAVPVEDGRGHGVQADLQLLLCPGVAGLPHLGEVLLQLRLRGDGVRRDLLQADLGQQRGALLGGQVRQQDLAARRRVQRGQLADPVVRGDRSGAAHLVEVDRVVLLQHRDVDRLADLLGEPLAHRAALLGDVDTTRDRAGQADDAKSEPVLATLTRLLHQAARLQGAEQAERGGFVNIDLGGHLADTRLPALGEDLEDADGPVDRLHSAGLRI